MDEDRQEPYYCPICDVRHRPGTKIYEEHLHFKEVVDEEESDDEEDEEDETSLEFRFNRLEVVVGKLIEKVLPQEQVFTHKYRFDIGNELAFLLWTFGLFALCIAFLIFGGQ